MGGKNIFAYIHTYSRIRIVIIVTTFLYPACFQTSSGKTVAKDEDEDEEVVTPPRCVQDDDEVELAVLRSGCGILGAISAALATKKGRHAIAQAFRLALAWVIVHGGALIRSRCRRDAPGSRVPVSAAIFNGHRHVNVTRLDDVESGYEIPVVRPHFVRPSPAISRPQTTSFRPIDPPRPQLPLPAAAIVAARALTPLTPPVSPPPPPPAPLIPPVVLPPVIEEQPEEPTATPPFAIALVTARAGLRRASNTIGGARPRDSNTIGGARPVRVPTVPPPKPATGWAALRPRDWPIASVSPVDNIAQPPVDSIAQPPVDDSIAQPPPELEEEEEEEEPRAYNAAAAERAVDRQIAEAEVHAYENMRPLPPRAAAAMSAIKRQYRI
jgi:hypothetical protein